MNQDLNTTTRRLAQGGAIFSGSVGLIAGVGWMLGRWQITVFGPDDIPMAPLTAWLFVLLSATVFAVARWPARKTTRVFGLAAALIVGSIGMWDGVGMSGTAGLSIEQRLAATTETVRGIPVGRMSLLTAIAFVLTALALLSALLPVAPSRFRRHLTAGFGAAALLISLGVILSYALNMPLFYGSGQVPMALVTAIAFAALIMALLLSAGAGIWSASATTLGVAAFAIVGVLVLAGTGIWFYNSQQQSLRQDTEANLETIAQLKLDQIVQWRNERLADASVLMDSPLLTEAVAKWLETSDPTLAEELLACFRASSKHQHYQDVVLMDTDGQVRLSLNGNRNPLPGNTSQTLAAALRDQQPVLSELHVGPGDLPPHLDVVAPLMVKSNGTVHVFAAVVLQCDAHEFLFPLIQSWPTRSASAETLLVRRDGDAVLYLNDLRHQGDTALKLRIPLTQTNVPAVMAVLGRAGFVQGLDYRGVEIVAVPKAVPGTPWFIVAKVDAAEAFAVWRFRSELLLAVIFGFVIIAAAAAGLVWRRKTRFWQYTRSLIEASLDPLVTISPEGKITDVNQAAESATGVSRAGLIGTDFCDYFTEPEKARAGYQQVFREGLVRDYALELRRADGHVTPVLYNASVYRDVSGKVVGVFAAARDITERKRAEETLRQANAYNRSLLEASLDPLVTIGPDGKITDVNAATEAVTGRSRADLIGSDFCDYFTEPEKARAGYQQVFSEGMVQDYALELRHDDGHITSVLYNASVYRDETGQAVGVFAAARDITERKQAEEKVKGYTEELRRSNQELEHFAYVASHDLQEPLRAVSSFSQMLAQRYLNKLDADANDFINFIVDGATRMQTLINDLLTFSRVGTRGKPFAPAACGEILQVALGNLDAAIADSGANVTHDPLPMVLADPTQLTQLFQNLCGNAIKFRRPAETPRIHVSAARQDGVWQFDVRDNGVGIESKYFDRIFIIFQRLHEREEYPGTGIGLAVCKKIVERHGGRIWVESEPGNGSTFHFTLPDRKEKP